MLKSKYQHIIISISIVIGGIIGGMIKSGEYKFHFLHIFSLIGGIYYYFMFNDGYFLQKKSGLFIGKYKQQLLQLGFKINSNQSMAILNQGHSRVIITDLKTKLLRNYEIAIIINKGDKQEIIKTIRYFWRIPDFSNVCESWIKNSSVP